MIPINRLLKAALETFSNFVVVDQKGSIVYINDIYAKLLGTTPQDAIGKSAAAVIPNTRMEEVLRTGEAEIGSVMTLLDHTKNQEVTLVCNRLPIRQNGRVIGAVAATTMNSIFDVEALHQEIEQIKQENQSYKAHLNALEKRLNPLERVIGYSEPIKEIKRIIADYADSNLTLLITGETGVGKEVFAKAVHQLSSRFLNNYVKINCSAIPQNLLESELFGYVEGAFSGAVKGGKIGKFELASNGTLLLDEIGEMSMELQAKLLRVLQEKEIERVGSLDTIKIDVRIICSTNRNLEQMVKDGLFREDLYYRINVMELNIPPLRERPGDLAPLSSFFIGRINQENGYQITGIDEDVLRLFQEYSWPGNVRELEHTIERAAVMCKNTAMKLSHFDFLKERINRAVTCDAPAATLRSQTERAERDTILQMLKQTGGNKTKAAELLNIDRSGLYSRIKKYKIEL